MYAHHFTEPITYPLPEPAKLVALTHRPRHWWVARFLALAGNGIPLPCGTRLLMDEHQ